MICNSFSSLLEIKARSPTYKASTQAPFVISPAQFLNVNGEKIKHTPWCSGFTPGSEWGTICTATDHTGLTMCKASDLTPMISLPLSISNFKEILADFPKSI